MEDKFTKEMSKRLSREQKALDKIVERMTMKDTDAIATMVSPKDLLVSVTAKILEIVKELESGAPIDNSDKLPSLTSVTEKAKEVFIKAQSLDLIRVKPLAGNKSTCALVLRKDVKLRTDEARNIDTGLIISNTSSDKKVVLCGDAVDTMETSVTVSDIKCDLNVNGDKLITPGDLGKRLWFQAYNMGRGERVIKRGSIIGFVAILPPLTDLVYVEDLTVDKEVVGVKKITKPKLLTDKLYGVCNNCGKEVCLEPERAEGVLVPYYNEGDLPKGSDPCACGGAVYHDDLFMKAVDESKVPLAEVKDYVRLGAK